MKIIAEYLVFLTRQNGPDTYKSLALVRETQGGYFFEQSERGSFFQISKDDFLNAVEYTRKEMPGLFVQYSQPRVK